MPRDDRFLAVAESFAERPLLVIDARGYAVVTGFRFGIGNTGDFVRPFQRDTHLVLLPARS